MIRTKIYHIALALIVCGLFFSCRKPPEEEDTEETVYNVWVLNEGLWHMNNSSITAYNTFTGQKRNDIYAHANNNRQLGDIANDMQRYGSKVYVALNMSSRLDILDAATGISLRQIPLTDNGSARQPRELACYDGKVYVCCFDGSVVKIDTTSLHIEATVKAGRNPDGICAVNNKLYVSNSGGLDNPNYDSTVSVFDLG
ncbi:MAG: YncE family protein, partial [Bacteroidales bacterium]|nr:YncE family protein [Bacteroidales bacterium]